MAENIEESVLLKVDIKADDALKKYGQLQQEIARLRDEQEKLRKENLQGTDAWYENEQAIKALSARSREYQKEVQNNVKENHEQNGSLQQLKASLSLMTAEYNKLSREEREGARGQELAKGINEVTNELNKAEQGLQNYRRNVGNYEGALRSVLGVQGGFIGNLQQLGALTQGGLSQGLKSATSAVGALGKQFLALLANPIVATIALIAGALMTLKNALNSSEEGTNALQRVMAPLQGLLDIVTNALQKMASVIIAGVEGMEQMAMTLSKLAESLPLVGDAFKSVNTAIENQVEAMKAQQEATRMEREMLITTADAENKVAKLKSEIARKDKYTADERRKMLQQALDLERKEADAQVQLAKQRLKALELEAKNTGNTAEMKRKLAEATAQVTKADTEYYNTTMRMQQRLSSFNQELAKDAEDASKQAKERASKERDARRAEEDVTISLIINQYDQRRATINNQYNRQIEDLRIRLKEEQNLTATARESINATIIQLQEKQRRELAKIGEDERKDLRKVLDDLASMVESAEAKRVAGVLKTYEDARTKAQEQMDALKAKLMEGTATEEEQEAYYELSLRILELEEQKQEELSRIAREGVALRINEAIKAIDDGSVIELAKYTTTEREKNAIQLKASQERIALYKRELENTTDEKTRLELTRKIAEEEKKIQATTIKDNHDALAQELTDKTLTEKNKYDIKMQYLQAEMEAVRGNADEERRVMQEIEDATSEHYQNMGNAISEWGSQAMGAVSALGSFMEQVNKKELDDYKKGQDDKKKQLKKRLDAGLMTEEQYNAQVQKIDEETAKKEKEIALENAKWQKAQAVMNAMLASAQAIIMSLAMSPISYGPIPNPAGIASLALATTTGALQVATALATPLPTAGSGMYIEGADHAHGGVLINAEGGEAIINKRATAKYLPLLSQINQSTGGVPLYGAGGIAGIQSAQAMESAFDYEALAEACANIPVSVSVVDINDGQSRVARLDERRKY